MGEESTPGALGEVRSAAGAVAEILKAAKENPEAAEAGRTAAKSLNVLSSSLYSMLMPLRVLNYGAAKVEAYFAAKFGQELGSKLAGLAPEDIVEPKTYIAGPVIQGIADTVEEPDLRDMYTSLLASAMSEQAASQVHPSYVEIIKQLSPHEVEALQGVLRQQQLPAATLFTQFPDGSHITHERNLVPIFKFPSDYDPVVVRTGASWIENWHRLGLIEVDYANHLSNDAAYEWVEGRLEFTHRSTFIREGEALRFKKGLIRRTDFGVGFAEAVGILTDATLDTQEMDADRPNADPDPSNP